MEATTTENEYSAYIVRNSKVYHNLKGAARLLGYEKYNTFEVAILRAKRKEKMRNFCYWQELIDSSILENSFVYYPEHLLVAFKTLVEEQDDFSYKIVFAFEKIIEQEIYTLDELAQILGITKQTLSGYLGSSTPSFIEALRFYIILKGAQWDLPAINLDSLSWKL